MQTELAGKSVMVTGGAGFIGSYLVDALVDEKPKELVVVDTMFLGKEENLRGAKAGFKDLRFYKKDAANFPDMKKIIEKHEVEVVYNLAILPLPASLEKPGETTNENIKMVTNMCELQRLGFFKTLIHFSSSEAYGTAETIPMDESHPLNPTTPYAASKAAGDHIVLSYCKTFGTDSAILRPFNNYGPRQNEGSYAGIIPLTIKRIMNGESPVIYGDGKQTRDYIYVTDTARMAIEMYRKEKTRGKIINIGSGKEVSVIEIVKLIMELTGCRKKILYGENRPGDVRRHLASVSLAKQILNFEPKVSFDIGIKNTVRWYESAMREPVA